MYTSTLRSKCWAWPERLPVGLIYSVSWRSALIGCRASSLSLDPMHDELPPRLHDQARNFSTSWRGINGASLLQHTFSSFEDAYELNVASRLRCSGHNCVICADGVIDRANTTRKGNFRNVSVTFGSPGGYYTKYSNQLSVSAVVVLMSTWILWQTLYFRLAHTSRQTDERKSFLIK